MKISNETKIGALTAIAISFLILGFNFLKGRSFFKTGTFYYGKFSEAKQLKPSNPIYINGFQVGSVSEIDAGDRNVSKVLVEMKMNAEYNIPENSVAKIESSFAGSPSIIIVPGNSTTYLKNGDTLQTMEYGGLLGDLSDKLTPVADQLKASLGSLDTVLRNFNTVLDLNTKGNLQSTISNLNKITASMAVSARALQSMFDEKTGSLTQSLNNIDSFTSNLASNNDKITSMMGNIEKTTDNLSKADIDGAINNLKSSAEQLNAILEKVNSGNGSLGALINQKELYNNLNNTIRSMNILMDDLRAHPKRYVNISVFGKKDKGNYLTAPLNDSTSSQDKK